MLRTRRRNVPRNPGHLPDECIVESEDGTVTYRAVHVRLFCGWDSKKVGAAPWPSKGGRPSDTVWRVSEPPHGFQIESYEVV